MANSNLINVSQKLLAGGLMAMRQNAVTARLVNRTYDSLAAQKGATIDIPIPSAIPARDVTPSNVLPAPVDVSPTLAQITFDFWKEGAFGLTDKERAQVAEGLLMPMQATEAVKGVVNALDAYLLNKMKLALFNSTGTAGTTPFATDTSAYQAARLLLNTELAPQGDRRSLLNPDAEANISALALFTAADQRGDTVGITEQMLGKKLGAEWYMNQNLTTHTAGVPGGVPLVVGAHAIGDEEVSIDGMTATTGTYKQGDVVSFAGSDQTYVITADVTASGTGTATLPIYPALRSALADNAAVTLKADHTNNFLFHRDAIALATRPLQPADPELGVITQSAVDPITGLTLRLEITRQHRQTVFAYDILAGATVPRPEWGVRMLG